MHLEHKKGLKKYWKIFSTQERSKKILENIFLNYYITYMYINTSFGSSQIMS